MIFSFHFSLIFCLFFFFIIFRYNLSFGILFIAGENDRKTDPDVENKSDNCDDRDNQHDHESVMLSGKNCKRNSLNKQPRKQMTILDYCKSAKLNKLNESEAHIVDDELKLEITVPLLSRHEVMLLENKSDTESNSSISSRESVKLRRSHKKSIPSPVKVSAELQKMDMIDSESNKTNSANRSSCQLISIKNCSTSELAEEVTVVNVVDVESASSISSIVAIKSRKRTREKTVASPTEVPTKMVKKQQNNSNKGSSVSKSSRESISNKTSNKRCSTNNLAEDEEEEVYAVEKVVGIDVIGNEPHFHIKWKGYSASQNTWEPLSNLQNCPLLITKFITVEFEAKKNTVDNILLELKGHNANVLTDEDAFQKLKNFDAISVLSNLLLLATMKDSEDTNDESYKVIREKLRENNVTMLLSFWYRRNEQLKDLEEWQNDINKSDKSSQITVENNVDFEKSPSTFQYINDCVAGNGVHIPDDPLIGCDCKDGCSFKSNCCGKQLGSKYAYTSARAIRLPQGNAVFECNKLCKCGPDCTNRVVQQGRKHSLTIFKTSNGRGWGVRTDRVIGKGQYICEYVGEIITNKEAEDRGLVYDAEKRTYLFDLDCNSIVENKENLYTIDACKMGNVSRMINHSCDPNIGTWSVWINCLDLDIPKICFYALRRIEAGEELSFDYLNFSVHDVDNQMNDDQSLLKTNFECKCNSQKCRKYIFDPSLLNPVEK